MKEYIIPFAWITLVTAVVTILFLLYQTKIRKDNMEDRLNRCKNCKKCISIEKNGFRKYRINCYSWHEDLPIFCSKYEERKLNEKWSF